MDTLIYSDKWLKHRYINKRWITTSVLFKISVNQRSSLSLFYFPYSCLGFVLLTQMLPEELVFDLYLFPYTNWSIIFGGSVRESCVVGKCDILKTENVHQRCRIQSPSVVQCQWTDALKSALNKTTGAMTVTILFSHSLPLE